mmetsp:Transcript_12786/g.21985  ORF Transcript_12786/g.21985 Transcript_12786/m.21985 type:complete len:100 (-) Transcript_12786:375-674(-)
MCLDSSSHSADDGSTREDKDMTISEQSKGMGASERIEMSVHHSVRKFGDATINRDIKAQTFEASQRAKETWEAGDEFDLRIAAMIAIYNTGSSLWVPLA